MSISLSFHLSLYICLPPILSFSPFCQLLLLVSSFLPGCTRLNQESALKVVVNGQAPESYELKAVVPQGSTLGLTQFLFDINDLPRNIVRSLVDIYADDTTLYGCISRNQDKKSLVADLSSDRSLTAQ